MILKVTEVVFVPNDRHHSKVTVVTRNVDDATVPRSTYTVQYKRKSV